jgi:uncharacterized membrane protein
MKEWLNVIADGVITIIHAMALLLIAVGTVQAFLRSIHAFFNPSPTGEHFSDGNLQYARWLVAGLTFQLAADILATSVAPAKN